MLKLIYLFTLFLLAFTDDFTETNHIITLGDPTFQHAIVQFPKALFVYYYSPYCEPCRKFWPEYDKVAQTLFDHHSEVKLAKIDCHDEVVLCDKHNVKHFPTLLLYRMGRDSYEYIGGLNSASVHEWIWKVVDSAYQAIDDEDTLFDRHSAAILVKNSRLEISEAYKEYPDEIEVAVPTEIMQLKVGNPTQSIIYTMGRNIIPIDDQANSKQIKDKINDVLYVGKLAVPTYNGKTAKKLQTGGDQTLVLFFKTESVTPSSASSQAFSKIAFEARNGGPLFYYVNVVDCRLGESVAGLFGIDERDEPTVGIIAKKGNVYEKYKLNLTADSADNIRDFVKYFETGHLQRYYMSADVPAEDEHQHIRELVTRNYDDVTRDTSLNVFVMLYFPWCDACVKVEPTLTSLAYRTRFMENLVFARIDMSKNDLEGFEFVDYPVFLFYPAGEKKVIQYLEEPRMKYLQDFLEEYVPGLKKDIEL